MKTRLLFVCLILIIFVMIGLFFKNSSTAEASQFDQGKKFSRAQAISDIDSMVQVIYTTHPNMYAIVPEATFKQEVEKVKSALPDSLTALSFYKRVAPLVTMLGDGHTSMWPPKELMEAKNCFFPMEVNIDPHTDVITTKSDGQEITAINGVKSQDIVNNMLNYSTGELKPFRIIKVANLFQIFMGALYPANKFEIEMIKDGVKSKTVVPAISGNEVKKPFQSDLVHYTYRFAKDGKTAIMEFNAFANPDKMKVFLDSMFTDFTAKGVKNLIIDVRQNSGGNSLVGDEVFQYISPVPFKQFGKTVVRISPLAKKTYSNFADKSEEFEYYEEGKPEDLRKNPLRCAGKMNIYLLTSAYTFSSASSFTWAFQYFKMGKIVGDETGGAIACFGDMLGYTLANTKSELGISFKKFYLYGVKDDIVRGVIPDIKVPANKALDHVLDNLIPASGS